MFGILDGYLKEPQGILIGRITEQVQQLDVAVQKRIGKGIGKPECLRGWLLRKSDVLVSGNHGLSDCGLVISFKRSHIVTRYTFKDEVTQRTATMDSVKRYNNAAVAVDLREAFLAYLRHIDSLGQCS